MMKRFLIICVLPICLLLAACGSSEEQAKSHYEKAAQLFEAGNTDEARIEAKNAVKADPEFAEAYLLLAKVSVAAQDWRGAFANFNRAAELNPNLVEARLGRGQIYLLSRQPDQAETEAQAVLELEPDNVDAHLLKAAILLQTEDLEGAERIFTSIQAEHPENTDAILGLVRVDEMKGNTAAATMRLDKAIAENPGSNVLLLKAAGMAEAAGNLDTAEARYLQLMNVVPNKAPVRLQLAKLHQRAGDLERAEKEMTQLVEENPDVPDYRLGLTGLLVQRKEFARAEEVLLSAPETDEPDIRFDLALAEVYMQQGETDRAKAKLRAVADERSDHPLSVKALVALGTVLAQEGDLNQALSVFEEAAERDPSPEVLFNRGKVKLAMQDYEGAMADLRVVTTELPDHLEARLLLAQSLLAQDNTLLAIEELHGILQSDPDFLPARNLLIAYYMRHGQWDMAADELDQMLDRDPESAELYVARGDVEMARGDVAAARKYYLQAKDLPDGEVPALLKLGDTANAEKDTDQALAYFEQALAENPKVYAGIERKALTLLGAERGDEAAAFGDEVLASMPDDPVVLEIFGRVAMGMDDPALAESRFRKASELAPDWLLPYRRLIGIYLASDETDKVIAQCRTTLEKNPDSLVEAFLLGQLLQVKGENQEAEDVYVSLLGKHPDFLPAANNLAYLIAETTDDPVRLEEALALAKKAAAEETPEALDTLGWVYYRLGDMELAVQNFRKALEGNPDNGTIVYHLALILSETGNKAEAKRIGQKALDKEGEFPERGELEELVNGL